MRSILGHCGLLLKTLASETAELIDRFDTPPSGPTVADIDALIVSLKENGIWEASDTIYVPMHAQAQQAGLLDWKRTTKAATINGTASWSGATGFVGADSAGAYIDPDFTPATDAVNLQLNNACYWMYVTGLPTVGTSGHYYFGRTGGTAARAIYVEGDVSYDAGGKIHSNAGNTGSAGNVSLNSLICMQRTGATAWAMYKNGVQLYADTDTSASSALSEVGLYILAAHNASSPGTSTGNTDAKIGAWGCGSQLTTNQMSALKTALETYAA